MGLGTEVNKREVLEKAKRYKRAFEKEMVNTVSFSKEGSVYSCVTFTRFGKTTGFHIVSSQSAAKEAAMDAFWNISMSTSLINHVTKGMRQHYSKSLEYLDQLDDLLNRWQMEVPEEARPFHENISSFHTLRQYFEESMKEIRELHLFLLDVVKKMRTSGEVTEQDTTKIIEASAKFNYLKYCQGRRQLESIPGIAEIDGWVKQNQKESSFKRMKELAKYTDYYISPKIKAYLDESLDDFKHYVEGMDLVHDAGREEAEKTFHERYLKEQKEIFQKEFVPILRS